LAGALKDEYGKHGYKINAGDMSYCLFRCFACCDAGAALILPWWGLSMKMSNKKSIDVLKISYIPPKEAVVAIAESMI